jgi:hypothetical protein
MRDCLAVHFYTLFLLIEPPNFTGHSFGLIGRHGRTAVTKSGDEQLEMLHT